MDISPLEGRQLPQPGRLVTRLRDVVIVTLPAVEKPRPLCTSTAISFADDLQADPQVFDVLLSFHYRAFKYRVNLIGLAKVRSLIGPSLRWWYGSPLDATEAHRALSEATYAALRPRDVKWHVEAPVIVTMTNGAADLARLPESDLLRRSVPSRYKLGLVKS
jgi:hypothetical protein